MTIGREVRELFSENPREVASTSYVPARVNELAGFDGLPPPQKKKKKRRLDPPVAESSMQPKFKVRSSMLSMTDQDR